MTKEEKGVFVKSIQVIRGQVNDYMNSSAMSGTQDDLKTFAAETSVKVITEEDGITTITGIGGNAVAIDAEGESQSVKVNGNNIVSNDGGTVAIEVSPKPQAVVRRIRSR